MTHRVLILAYSLANGDDNVIDKRIRRMIAAKFTEFGTQFCRAGIAQNG